jgi:hypothetical protein
MMFKILSISLLSLIAICAVSPALAQAQQSTPSQGGFKVVDNPGGGQYVYGPLSGRGTMPDAIIYMLRMVHSHFGERPEVGKFFQSRDGGSVSTFFTVTAKTQGDKPMAGLLIVTRAADGAASAAVLYDERARFGSSEPVMMKSLSTVWQPVNSGSSASQGAVSGGTAAARGSQGAAAAAVPAQLVQTSGGDGSASIGLPAGWKVTRVASGLLAASGSHGEMLFLGIVYQGLPPQGPDLFANFVNVSNQYRRSNGMQPGTYTAVHQINLPGQAIQATFVVDFNDGVGPRRGSVRVGSWGPRAMSVDGSNIPERYADEENATMLAVIHSYRQNEQMMAQLRQGAMNRVQADAARANAQSAAINARREANTAAFNTHMDNIDRSSKINQDYILDRSVVRDNENSERGTLSNSYADSLVRSNPDRFQIVADQDLIKGKDF